MKVKSIGRLILKVIMVAAILTAIVVTVELVLFFEDDAFWEAIGTDTTGGTDANYDYDERY